MQRLIVLLILLSASPSFAGEAFLSMCNSQMLSAEEEITIKAIRAKFKAKSCHATQKLLDGLDKVEMTFAPGFGLIHSLKPFSDLDNLRKIRVSGNVKSLSAVSKLKKLEKIYIFDGYLSDLSPLKSLPQLKVLELVNSPHAFEKEIGVRDVADIAHLVNLERLVFRNHQLEDITALMGMSNLRHLGFEGNFNLKNISALRFLGSLNSFSVFCEDFSSKCRREGLRNLGEFIDVKRMIGLSVKNIGLKNFSFLNQAKSLMNLKLSGNPIEDFSFLDHINPEISSLDLSRTQFYDIKKLERLIGLSHLGLDFNSYENIAFLNKLKNIFKFSCKSCGIKSLKGLKNKRLKYLVLNDNEITDLNVEISTEIKLKLDGNPVTKDKCPVNHENKSISDFCKGLHN